MPKPPRPGGGGTPPAITGFTSDSGTLGDGLTNDSTPTLGGTSDAGADVRIYAGGVLLGTTRADANGQWSFTTPALADGSYSFTAEVGKGGNLKSSGPFALEIDSVTPPPVITSALAETGGVRLTGTAEDGATVTIERDGVAVGAVTAVGGLWEFLDTGYAGGTVNYTAVATDAADNSAASAGGFVFPPAPNTAPVITSPAAVSLAENQAAVLDVEAGDDADAEGAGLSYAITGGADAALFTIDPASGALAFRAAPDFEAPADAGADNLYQVQVTVTDSGGLSAAQDIAVTVTDAAENTAPVITSPAAVSLAENQAAVLDVEAGDDADAEGAGLSYAITGGADAALFTIDPASGALAFRAAPDFEAPADAGADNLYQVQVTVTDSGGLSAAQDIAVTVTDAAENTAPALDLDGSAAGAGYAVTFGENGTPVAIADVDAVIADEDDTHLTRAVIILANPQPGDALVVNVAGLPAGIAVDPASTATQVILGGSATLADYQAALQQIVFDNPGDTPGATSRMIEVTVEDAAARSNVAVATVQVDLAPDPLDDSATTQIGTAVTTGDVLANDEPGDGSAAITGFDAVSSAGGSIVDSGNNTFTYTPPAGFIGTDSFTYTIADSDGDSSTATVIVTVSDSAPITFETQVAASTDDAEERSSGSMKLTSTDLEMTVDGTSVQTVGIRFTGIDIPRYAIITRAYIQFQTDETSLGAASLLIRGEDSDDAAAFANIYFNISSRPTTDASVSWAPDAWTTVGEAGLAQQTPDLSAIVQEIVSRQGWTTLNDMVFMISGGGTRTAEAFDGQALAAPLLHIEWLPPGSDTTPPSVTITGPAENATVSGLVNIVADAFDNVAVASVQFRIDGVAIGAPDTDAPYRVDFDTTLLSDGPAALSAVATDASGNQTVSAPVSVTIDNSTSPPPPPPPPPSGVIRVPEDYPTIQAAIDAAGDGDTVLVAPGTYAGGFIIAGKSITLASHYLTTGDPWHIDNTIISGGAPAIRVDASAPNTVIQGFHFVGGEDSVQFFAQGGQALDNFFDDTVNDAISFEEVGGIARGNRIFSPGDDGVDVDHTTGDVLIENNLIEFARDDGIEIRNASYAGPMVRITIRGNEISGAQADGIQLIDYAGLANREFLIEDNLITGSLAAGLGIMDNGETTEDFRAASMPERVYLFGNTFDGNLYGITGGDNLIAVNNIISNSPVLGMKNIDGNSIVAHTLFWNNGTDQTGSNLDIATIFSGDPLYTADFGLAAGSPAIDAGTANFVHNGETVLDIPAAEFAGSAPDLGWYEFGLSAGAPTDVTLAAAQPLTENAAGAVAGSLSVTDRDFADTHSFTVSDARFEVIGSLLKLKDGVRIDFEREPQVTLDITAADSGGLSVTRPVTVHVGDVGEVRFAAFGDYGNGSGMLAVANLIASWNVDFIVTTGDNGYDAQVPLDDQIGPAYRDYIGNYNGAYGSGSGINRFFPSLGNHDYEDIGVNAYLDYFTLPDNERYYDFQMGPVHFFALNSNSQEPDGNDSGSLQAQWLQAGLAGSSGPFSIAYFHHAAYSSGLHGSRGTMQWPFEDWGATAILAGHDHIYERILRDDNSDAGVLPYFVTGLGGRGIYGFNQPVAGSEVRYNGDYGAMLIQASDATITFQFWSIADGGTLIDSYTIERAGADPLRADGDDYMSGGPASDYMNGLSGDDRLDGMGGDDELVGGAGSDTFVFQPGFGHDLVSDFIPGAEFGDVIELRSLGYGAFDEVMADAVQTGGDVVIQVDANNSIRLLNVDLGLLQADDFLFLP
jgi:hypothetical protein